MFFNTFGCKDILYRLPQNPSETFDINLENLNEKITQGVTEKHIENFLNNLKYIEIFKS